MWVKTSDRLPEINQDVLLYHDSSGPFRIHIGHLYDDNEYDRSKARKKEKYPPKLSWMAFEFEFDIEDVTHWMELPKGPNDILT